MFRELARKKKQISMEECIQVLTNEKRGVLSVLGDEDYPYGMPMNHFYNEEDGKMEVVDDLDMVVYISDKLSRKFTEDDAYIKEEIKNYAHQTLLLKLTPEHVCGKMVTES